MITEFTITETGTALRVIAKTTRDKAALDLFSNNRQGGTPTMRVEDDGTVVIVNNPVEVK